MRTWLFREGGKAPWATTWATAKASILQPQRYITSTQHAPRANVLNDTHDVTSRPKVHIAVAIAVREERKIAAAYTPKVDCFLYSSACMQHLRYSSYSISTWAGPHIYTLGFGFDSIAKEPRHSRSFGDTWPSY